MYIKKEKVENCVRVYKYNYLLVHHGFSATVNLKNSIIFVTKY